MEQEKIKISKIDVPIIIDEGGEKYYPIRYIGDKVLLKNLTGNQLIKNGYGQYIKQFNVDFGEGTGGIQSTYCVSEIGLKEILSKSRIGGLSVEQKKVMNTVCKYIGLNIEIDTEEKFLDSYPESKWREYDFWDAECIESILEKLPDIQWQRCSKCGNYYPYHKCFFGKESNLKNKADLKTICNICYPSAVISHYDKNLNKVYQNGGELLYNLYKNNNIDVYEIYWLYYNEKLKRYPSILRNSLYTTNIIYKYYKQNILDNIDDFNLKFISEISKIPLEYISLKALDKTIFSKIKKEKLLESKISNDTTKISSHVVKKVISKMTFEDTKELIDMYCLNNNIIFDDVYNFNYNDLFKQTKVLWYIEKIEKDKLGFVMKYFNNQYAAYRFKSVRGQNYWNNRDNTDRAMKYFIEQDLKIPIEKIPLYVTKNNLQIKCRTLYGILYNKKFDNCLFDWINRLYPDKFIEEDFAVGIIRNQFDSMEEKMIHDMLKQKFSNVLYNNRQSENKITIMGINPDWFIFTDNNIYIIEYFGIALDQRIYNKRISDYVDKTKVKLSKYKDLQYAIKIFLYPEDIKNECDGFYNKIKQIC